MSAGLGLYTLSLEGHRASYLQFIRRLIGGERIGGWRMLWHRGPVLCLMVDEHFLHYTCAAVLRACLARRTAGLMFRPGPALEPRSAKFRVKHWLLRLLRRIPAVRTLTIIPFGLEPRFAKIADGWIHDFQLWDLPEEDRARFTRLKTGDGDEDSGFGFFRNLRDHAGAEPLLVALGVQNIYKGTPLLATALEGGGLEGWRLAVAGRISDEVSAARTGLAAAGALICDRFIADEEVIAAYAAADAVWCLYHPAYDQASGILGRAAQLGVPAIVRQGSFSEAFCREEGIPHVAVSADDTRIGPDLARALASLPPVAPQTGSALAARLAADSTARLRDALDLPA